MTFRDDGYRAVDWAADYLERVGELPVLAQVKPGDIRALLTEAARNGCADEIAQGDWAGVHRSLAAQITTRE